MVLGYNLFGSLEQHLEGPRYKNNEEVEMAISEWLRMQGRYFYCSGIFKHIPRGEDGSLRS
jgi:hypothetical protein